MKKVAVICVHNSCRSQIAEALGKKLVGDVFESYSAGTETKPQINQDAVRLIEEMVPFAEFNITWGGSLCNEPPHVSVRISQRWHPEKTAWS